MFEMDPLSNHAMGSESLIPKSRRAYVACIPCRNRKVKCQINEYPPCVKCRREHRECYFTQSKAGPKHRDPPRWVPGDNNTVQRPGRTDHNQDDADMLHVDPSSIDNATDPSHLDTPNLQPEPHQYGQDEQVIISSVIAQPRQALDILFTTARPNPDARQSPRPPTSQKHTPSDVVSPQIVRSLNMREPPGQYAPSPLSNVADDVLDAWDDFRFVRQGWFTSQEAVTYVDLFFQNIAPMCPLLFDAYKDHNNHKPLILQDPMLCCTILAISSRFHVLSGPGGYSRGHFIHSRLWQHCERLIQRVMMGQEKTSSAKVRTIGTIEAFILVSDWHPRALHFPPETDGWDSAFLPEVWKRQERIANDGNAPFIRWQEDVFAAAKMSDRMSWILLGAATNLLYELGPDIERTTITQTSPETPRKFRVRHVLGVFVTQLATRLGQTSFLPSLFNDYLTLPIPLNILDPPADSSWRTLMSKWVELTSLEKTASVIFFQSPTTLKQLLSANRYIDLIRHFMPTLDSWLKECDEAQDLPPLLKHTLMIQFYHLRISIKAISLQAVVERAAIQSRQPGAQHIWHTENSFGHCILPQDQAFIGDVIEDCQSVLRVATGFAETKALRYTPLRILIHITSASVFLLKAMSIGIRDTELRLSLGILEQSIEVLKSSPIDDMDFAARYASLIDKQVQRYKSNFKLSHPTRNNSPGQVNRTMQHNTNHQPIHTLHMQPSNSSANVDDVQFLDSVVDVESAIPKNVNDTFGNGEWWSQPFNPAVAPFSMSNDHLSWGLELESLDFLWDLPE